jgi:hypothetical protein
MRKSWRARDGAGPGDLIDAATRLLRLLGQPVTSAFSRR